MSDDDKKDGNDEKATVSRLHVVPLQTDNQQRSQMCVLKLEELLAQAKQGQYIGLVFIGIQPNPPNNTLAFHFSQKDQEIIFLGGIEVVKKMLLSNIKFN